MAGRLPRHILHYRHGAEHVRCSDKLPYSFLASAAVAGAAIPICLAIEVFGGQCVSLFALACAVSYMLSSYFSLYREQHFLHSKLRIVGVQRVHGHWSETDAVHLTTNGDGEN